MLEYSVRMHEKIIRKAVPDASEEEIDQIIYANNWYNLFTTQLVGT